MNWIVKIIQGALIGAGGVLPGVSGGVLAVLFGVYKPLMRLLAHPIKELKNSIVSLWPIIVGFLIGYVGIAKVLEMLLVNYQSQSLAVFVGMAIGIMPSLFREAGEKGRNRNSWISFGVVFAVAFGILLACNRLQLLINPNFAWNMFGGACLALSIIAPGMSASVLMLPLMMPGAVEGETATFYGHVTGSIGSILDVFKGAVPDWGALAAIIVGAVVTFVLLTRAVDWMMNNHYSVMFHGIIGLVIAASIFTIPFGAFTASVPSCLIHIVFVVLGCVCTLLLDKFNSKVEKPPVEDEAEVKTKA